MIFNILIALSLIALLLYKFRKGVILIAVLSITLNFLNFPIEALHSVYDVVVFFSLLLGCYHYGGGKIVKHPLSFCVLFPLVSLCATMYFFEFSWGYLIRAFVQYVFPVILYFSLRTKEDMRFYVQVMKVYLTCAVLYAFFEVAVQYNPIMNWCEQHAQNFGWITQNAGGGKIRFGFKRAQSFFGGSAAFATVCIYFWFIIYRFRKDALDLSTRWMAFLFIATPIAVLFTGTRSAIVTMAIMMLPMFSFKSMKRNSWYVVLVIVGVAVFSPYFVEIYNSVVNSDEAAMGSSEDMRETQWNIAFYFLSKNLYVGNGLGFTGTMVIGQEEGILGAEGMWLPIMMDRGIIGVIATASAYIITFIFLWRRRLFSEMLILFSFLFFKTITTVVGVGEGYYLLIIVFLLRYQNLYFNHKE